jgi:carboxypeptidase C (cathepsin A)
MLKQAAVPFAFVILVLNPVSVSHISAQEGKRQKEASEVDVITEVLEEELVETTHKARIGGRDVEYKACAGTISLIDDEGNEKASVFYIAYTKIGRSAPKDRPVTFSFNGGPGSSSVWLHLGLLGPKIVSMMDDGTAYPPPYELVINENSLLSVTDIVFIDPVSTGYSRPAEGEDKSQFHGVEEDIKWVGEFIRLYVTRSERWGSPKFLIGESYGTTRAAGLSGYLQERHGMFLSGIMLVSSILNFQTTDFHVGNDLPYALFLPTYTATAWYHGRLGEKYDGNLQSALADAEEFALGEYASVLMLGDAAPKQRSDAAAARLAELTGLSVEYIRSTDLRVKIWRFVKELLREKDLTAGRLDTRFTGRDRDSAGESYEYDPSYANIYGPYSACINDYVRRELDFESDLPYEVLTGNVRPWNFGKYRNRYVNVAETLRSAMTRNPSLRVYIASGYYDLATPYFATDYTVDHLGLPPELRGNIAVSYYEAGHMMYIHKDSRLKLLDELSDFVEGASQ